MWVKLSIDNYDVLPKQINFKKLVEGLKVVGEELIMSSHLMSSRNLIRNVLKEDINSLKGDYEITYKYVSYQAI